MAHVHTCISVGHCLGEHKQSGRRHLADCKKPPLQCIQDIFFAHGTNVHILLIQIHHVLKDLYLNLGYIKLFFDVSEELERIAIAACQMRRRFGIANCQR